MCFALRSDMHKITLEYPTFVLRNVEKPKKDCSVKKVLHNKQDRMIFM